MNGEWKVRGVFKYHGSSGKGETFQNIPKMRASEENTQPGCIIRIRKEEKRLAKRHGMVLDSEHVIQKPPAGKLNSGMAVWVKGGKGKLINLPFPFWLTTAKKAKTKSKLKRTKKH